MKTASSIKDSQELAGLVQKARLRVATAERRRKADAKVKYSEVRLVQRRF